MERPRPRAVFWIDKKRSDAVARPGRFDHHARYEHTSRPARLHVACPRCEARCEAFKESEPEPGGRGSEALYALSDWVVTCSRCTFRARGLSYEDLPALYYQTDTLGLWAWNREQLTMLLRVIEGRSVEGHPYRLYATYVKREWRLKRYRRRLVKAVKELLAS